METEEHAICIVGPLDANSSTGAPCSSKQKERPLDTLFSTAAAEEEARKVIQRRLSSCSGVAEPILLSQDSDCSSFSCVTAPASDAHTCSCHQLLQDTVAATGLCVHTCSSQQLLQDTVAATGLCVHTCSSQQQQEAAAAVETATAEQSVQQKRHHRHRHRHRQHHSHGKQHQQQEVPAQQHGVVERSISAFVLPSLIAGHCSHTNRCDSPNMEAMVEERRPKSFTLGQHYRPPNQCFTHSTPGSTPALHSSCRTPLASGPRQAHPSKLLQQQQHVTVRGRRSPLQAALLSKHTGGVGGYVCATDGSFTGPPMAVVPKPERVMSESLKPEIIAKGFAGHWLSRRSIDVFTGSRVAAVAGVLRSLLPRCPGLHLWLVKPPRSRCWVPIHLGAAGNLQSVGEQYMHDDGSCGPAVEPFKYKVFMDLMRRGFAVQLRFRPLKSAAASVAEDLLSKLRQFDFPLNDKDNGGCRPIELPNGWQVTEYPVKVDWVNALYEHKFGPHRMM